MSASRFQNGRERLGKTADDLLVAQAQHAKTLARKPRIAFDVPLRGQAMNAAVRLHHQPGGVGSMNPVEELERKLGAHPEVGFRRSGDGIEIDPVGEGGFPIRLGRGEGGWLVGFGDGGFHERFDDPRDVLSFVAFGLSQDCRLRELNLPLLHRSLVERREGETWRLVYEVGTLRLPFGRRLPQGVFQNTLFPPHS